MNMLLEHEPLARYTSWKIGGPARFLIDAQTPEQLRAAVAWAHDRELPLFVLGGGSNVLVRDAGFAGVIVRYRANEYTLDDHGDTAIVRIDAGAPMAGTVRKLTRLGYAGLEWAEGLPGTIGGAVYGNAGCYGSDTASNVRRAWLLVDNEIEEWTVEKLCYGYRTSALKHGAALPSTFHRPIVLAAEFVLRHAEPIALLGKMAQTSEIRRSKTPQGQSCGSVFKNPPNDSAGRLVEAAGLKSTRIGGAEIADKHANYIVNRGGATSDDVLRLVELVRERVLHVFGIELELEVQILGTV